MNNIDILEELINGFDNLISYKQKQAIENLIAENKELKEENLSKSGIYKFNINIEEDYIPKSKVKEILQKYKYTELGDDYKIIQFYKELQSLLGKE